MVPLTPGQPALAVAGETAWIAVRDPWNSYSVQTYTLGCGFGSWPWLQGVLAADPQIAGCPNGDLHVTGRDNWNGFWTRRYPASNGHWQPWRFIGGIISGAPALACGSDNAAYVAARDAVNNMWLARVVQEVQATWHYGAGIIQGDLKVVANGGLIHVAGLSAGVPWYRTWEIASLNWEEPFAQPPLWRSPGGVLAHFAPAVYGGNPSQFLNGNLFMAGQDAGGNLWWWSSVSQSWTNFGNKNVAPGSGLSAGGR